MVLRLHALLRLLSKVLPPVFSKVLPPVLRIGLRSSVTSQTTTWSARETRCARTVLHAASFPLKLCPRVCLCGTAWLRSHCTTPVWPNSPALPVAQVRKKDRANFLEMWHKIVNLAPEAVTTRPIWHSQTHEAGCAG